MKVENEMITEVRKFKDKYRAFDLQDNLVDLHVIGKEHKLLEGIYGEWRIDTSGESGKILNSFPLSEENQGFWQTRKTGWFLKPCMTRMEKQGFRLFLYDEEITVEEAEESNMFYLLLLEGNKYVELQDDGFAIGEITEEYGEAEFVCCEGKKETYRLNDSKGIVIDLSGDSALKECEITKNSNIRTIENSNIRTMEFVCVDDWNDDVYRCIETGVLYKDVSPSESEEPELYSCGNEIDGEPCYPINKNLEIHFTEREPQPTPAEKFNYQLLSRLQSDCKYYLSYGNRNEKHLWAGDEQEQINKMKELYNSFADDKKPEWLTYEQILQYEKLMIKSN